MNNKQKINKRKSLKRIVSIPSRFETKLIENSNNKLNGFGSTSKRFNLNNNNNNNNISLSLNDNVYFKLKSFESKSTSHSCKGYGVGFVSRTKRFKNNKNFQINSANYLCTDCHLKLHSIHTSTFNDKHSRSTSFSKSQSSSHSAYFKQEIKRLGTAPGPGSYETAANSCYIDNNKYNSSFSSKSKRYFDSIIDNKSKKTNNNQDNDDDDDDIFIQHNNNNIKKNNQNKYKAVPFNTSEKRFVFNENKTNQFIDDLLFQQYKFENSRKLIPYQSKKIILSKIMKEKSNSNNNYYYNNFNNNNNNAPIITSVFMSKTPKCSTSFSKIDDCTTPNVNLSLG